ncbi:MauE/DoxX family redox-associated membrane protein [Allostreptomyces psammosilenae]|uniref:Putative membrane protein YphA (DoxX/SURF4 family) n=1 Tax=Allostreptomyces psammosilenae TaxID=1892865 RepID=A0A852ZYA0_9ACTN|nr:MauE/DoxX family redox-associated membrane protein [Allostreptomyces psammosilenae]NYI07149.1 putative membrane protein YphA (DoxX/SURF4 family) [Allostreptomyces psammosilenae]
MSKTPRSSARGWRDWIGTVVRLGLVVVWGWAGLAKVSDPAEAAQAVRVFRVLPEPLVEPIGHGLPFVELGLALLLLLGLGTRLAAVVSAGLLLVFVAGISQAWARGLTIDCGCFGGGGEVHASETRYLEEILRDLGFLLLAGWLIVRPGSRLALDGALEPRRQADPDPDSDSDSEPDSEAAASEPVPDEQPASKEQPGSEPDQDRRPESDAPAPAPAAGLLPTHPVPPPHDGRETARTR